MTCKIKIILLFCLLTQDLTLLKCQTLFEVCKYPELLNFESNNQLFQIRSDGELESDFFMLNLSSSNNNSIDINSITNKEKVEYLTIVGRSPFDYNESFIIPEISQFKNVKYINIKNLIQKNEYKFILKQLAQMPNLIGLDIKELKYDNEDIANLKIIFGRLKHIIVGQLAKLPKENIVFENLLSLGFFGQPRVDDNILNTINAPKLNNVAFYILSDYITTPFSHEILNQLNKNFPNINELYFTGQYNLTLEHYRALNNFKNIKSLVYSDLGQNQYAFILPETIEKLTLHSLKYYNFNLDSIPKSKNLRSIVLKNFGNITYQNPQKSLPNLSNIAFINGNLEASKFRFDLFPDLQKLTLQNTGVSEIPVTVFNCKKLEYLDMSFNKILIVEEKIAQLIKLKKLLLNNNSIKSVPSNITKLKNLNFIDIQHNKLDTPPLDLLKIPNLESLIIGYLKDKNINCTLPKNDKTINYKKLKTIFWPNLQMTQNEIETFLNDSTSIDYVLIKSVDSLPNNGWSQKKGKFLHLGDILNSKIPDGIFHANINIIQFSLKLDNKNQIFILDNAISKKYAQYKLSKIPFDSINEIEIINFLNKRQALTYDDYNVMLKIDSSYTLNNVNLLNFFNQLYDKKSFYRVLSLVNFLLLKGNVDDSYVNNLIEIKNRILYAQNRKDEIFLNTIILDSIYKYNYGNDVGFYYLKKGNKLLAYEYFKKNIRENYINLQESNRNNKNNHYLNLIESLFLIDDYKSIDSLFSICKTEQRDFEDLNPVYHYLVQLRKCINNNLSLQELEELKTIKNKSNLNYLSKWSFDLIKQWKESKNESLKSRINVLNDIISKTELANTEMETSENEVIEMDFIDQVVENDVPSVKKYRPE